VRIVDFVTEEGKEGRKEGRGGVSLTMEKME
jgi:hypothetical protein